ncbi:MAG TPA: hypothetical protein VNM48_20820 [Chloroflexota bacterium]|nr:hypothetical protein [Chloroflexota bacterium]
MTSNARGRPTQSPLKRRWFRFGPGLLLAIVASVIVWRRMPPGTFGDSAPPRIETAQIEAFPASPPSAPDPAWLLSQRDTLRLSASQRKKLEMLRNRWERDTRELRGALDRASNEFNRSVRGAAKEGEHGLTIQQLQERAAPISELSRQLADARRAWWNEAAQILTNSQRQRAEEAWARRFTTKNNRNQKEPIDP